MLACHLVWPLAAESLVGAPLIGMGLTAECEVNGASMCLTLPR